MCSIEGSIYRFAPKLWHLNNFCTRKWFYSSPSCRSLLRSPHRYLPTALFTTILSAFGLSRLTSYYTPTLWKYWPALSSPFIKSPPNLDWGFFLMLIFFICSPLSIPHILFQYLDTPAKELIFEFIPQCCWSQNFSWNLNCISSLPLIRMLTILTVFCNK